MIEDTVLELIVNQWQRTVYKIFTVEYKAEMLVTKIKLNLVGTHTAKANIHDKKLQTFIKISSKKMQFLLLNFFGMQNFKGGNLIAKWAVYSKLLALYLIEEWLLKG